MTLRERLCKPGQYAALFAKWIALGLLVGLIGGLLGAAFHHTLRFVTELRTGHGWLILLLPVGGLVSVGLYKLFRMESNRGTNEIIDAILDGKPVNPFIAPVIFLASSITHLFGGSAGREGAALQLGGASASALGALLRLKDSDRTVLIMSGMSAVFAGLFGTPLTACLFTMEFESVGTLFTPALLPCFLAAFTASRLSAALGVHPEVFPLDTPVALSLDSGWRLLVLAVLLSLLGIAMCWLFHKGEHLGKRLLPNPWLRIALGGFVIVAVTALLGHQRYSGAGMEMALAACGAQAQWQDFLLKLLLTAITLSAGFKGGEIVPTFCIGATFGCCAGALLGLDGGFAGALGLVGLFCCVTNSPLTSIVLSVEMFGGANLYAFALVSVICFVLSGHSGLYASQILQFSKVSPPEKK